MDDCNGANGWEVAQNGFFSPVPRAIWGKLDLDALLERSDRFSVVALVLPTDKDRRIMAPYVKQGVKVIWGDLTRYEDVLEGVTGADFVLHVGGLVSPLADLNPSSR